MNVVYCFNDNSIKSDKEQITLLFTSLISLLENNKHVNIYIIYLQFNEENLAELKSFFKKDLDNIHLIPFPKKHYCELDYMVSKSVPANKGTFLRLFIGELLPETISKVLYLDTDTIIVAPLKGLYGSTFNGKSIQVVLDNNALFSREKETILGLRKNTYFNAGIIFINLDLIRESLLKKSLETFKGFTNIFADQDALNIIYNKSTKLIPNIYNCIVDNHYNKDAVIIHYAARGKILRIRPAIIAKKYRDIYWYYLEKTPYKEYKPNVNPLHVLTFISYNLLPDKLLLLLNQNTYYKKVMNMFSNYLLSLKSKKTK